MHLRFQHVLFITKTKNPNDNLAFFRLLINAFVHYVANKGSIIFSRNSKHLKSNLSLPYHLSHALLFPLVIYWHGFLQPNYIYWKSTHILKHIVSNSTLAQSQKVMYLQNIVIINKSHHLRFEYMEAVSSRIIILSWLDGILPSFLLCSLWEEEEATKEPGWWWVLAPGDDELHAVHDADYVIHTRGYKK